MTERIYYTEPSRRSFDGIVTRAFDRDGRPAVVLDRTAFYPTSGGQPFDTGQLGTATVLECVDEGDEVVHLLTAPLATGAQVHGDIDWDRRFDHMQQHTGQHVLSAAFERLFDNRTTSFHMGAETSTIDLARDASSSEIERAVSEANRVIWDDREVLIRFATAEEAARLPLRKEPARGGTLRLIEVSDFDLSACGGTHVARTGEIGMVAVTGTERVRGGVRLTFVCGGRAATAFRVLRDAVAGSVKSLSVLPHELPAAIERTQLDARELRKTVSRLQGALAVHEADRLLAGAPTVDRIRLVVQVLDGWDAAGLKAIASSLSAQNNAAVVLFSATESIAVVVARSQGVAVDASKVLRALLDRFGGRGGGRADLAQGAGLAGTAEERVAAARELLTRSG